MALRNHIELRVSSLLCFHFFLLSAMHDSAHSVIERRGTRCNTELSCTCSDGALSSSCHPLAQGPRADGGGSKAADWPLPARGIGAGDQSYCLLPFFLVVCEAQPPSTAVLLRLHAPHAFDLDQQPGGLLQTPAADTPCRRHRSTACTAAPPAPPQISAPPPPHHPPPPTSPSPPPAATFPHPPPHRAAFPLALAVVTAQLKAQVAELQAKYGKMTQKRLREVLIANACFHSGKKARRSAAVIAVVIFAPSPPSLSLRRCAAAGA